MDGLATVKVRVSDFERCNADLDRLEAENDALKESLAEAEHSESMAWDRTRKAEAENAKLRELVRIAVKYCDSGTCDGCPIQFESGGCPYSVMARELGVEVP